MNTIKKLVATPLSDSLVKQALGPDTLVLKYSELKNYETIDQLLPTIDSYFIILIEDNFNEGHWCCMCRLKDNSLFYFNSYAQKFDRDLSVIPMCIRRILGEDKKEITRLLDGKKCEWLKTTLQGNKSMVCGRWCVLFLTFVCKIGFSPDDFVEFIKEKSKELKLNKDQLCARLCPI